MTNWWSGDRCVEWDVLAMVGYYGQTNCPECEDGHKLYKTTCVYQPLTRQAGGVLVIMSYVAAELFKYFENYENMNEEKLIQIDDSLEKSLIGEVKLQWTK